MTTDAKKFSGPYQGIVVSNVDPTKAGRLLVRVEDVLGPDPCIWAAPLTPVAGQSNGMYVVPLEGSGVWVQFVDGDPDRAVYTGFWRGGVGDVPAAASSAPPGTPQIVLGTPTQNYLLISDVAGPSGGIQLQLHGPSGAYIKLSEDGVEIGAGGGGPTIKVTAAGIDLANGGLTVMAG